MRFENIRQWKTCANVINTIMDENALIQAARHGDVDAFNQLVVIYQDTVYTVAYRVIGEPDAAADAAQDAFISAYRNLRQFRGGQFKAWLLRIVTNACYDELRRRQRRPASSLDEFETVPADADPMRSHAPETPEQYAQRRELHHAIQDCLNALPDEQRVIAVLADVQEYPYQEIADMTGLKLGTVKSRLSRARAHLRECLRAVKELLPSEYRLMDN